jgi:hypothetical protein
MLRLLILADRSSPGNPDWLAVWRRGWDLNPRGALTPAGFQDRCIQPLCHPSGTKLRNIQYLRPGFPLFSEIRSEPGTLLSRRHYKEFT